MAIKIKNIDMINRRKGQVAIFVIVTIVLFVGFDFVSGQTGNIETCLLDVVGSYCQEYPAETCDSQCTEDCFPGSRDNFSPCELGTCYDPIHGSCGPGRSPRALCESNNGSVWSEDTPSQCNQGCCLLNPDGSGGASQAWLSTYRECNYHGQTSGALVDWDSSITNSPQCVSRVVSNLEGACVLELLPEGKYNCLRKTESTCLSSRGTFYPGVLCTNPDLNTICEMSQNTQCFDDKDQVYFVDSCGNRGNVYDSTKLNDFGYWSSIKNLEDSCSLSSGSNFLGNQQRCGNCDYISGSICGTPGSQDDPAIYGEYVCRDLSCIDRKGERREHGESWCVFDGRIGTDGGDGTNEERAVDVPGSRHYLEKCREGDVRLEPCRPDRNGVCVEGISNLTSLTTARCIGNTWNSCIEANENEDDLAECGENPACFLKHVEIDQFKFDTCAPKYPPGFGLSDEPEEDSEAICAVATQTCTYVEKKSFSGRWRCKVNCACKDVGFAETMNNLCMSLGDCGSHVNLAGELGDGYSTSGNEDPKISDNYIEGLKEYITPIDGQKVEYNESILREIFSLSDPNHPSASYWSRVGREFEHNWANVYAPVIPLALPLFGIGKYRTKTVNFNCLPWQPPSGGDNCEKCSELGVGECTEYKCKSLGRSCELLNPSNSTTRVCVGIDPGDPSAPQISFNESSLDDGFTYDEFANGVEIKTEDGDGCLQEYSPVTFGIQLNKHGQCKISSVRPEDGYDEMQGNFFDSSGNNYVLSHTEYVIMETLDSLGVSGVNPNRRGDYDLYVLCEDNDGNSNEAAYNIRFCVSPEDDLTPPIINNRFVPVSPGVVGFNSSSFNLKFYTNEPANCKWSLQDIPYETMENEASCDNGLNQGIANEWLCRAVLNVSQIENDYYFRCADKPWLGVNVGPSSTTLEAGRNVATEGEKFVVKRTETPLTISSITPNERVLFSAGEPVVVTLDVSTSGGIESGKAICDYSFNGISYIEFRNTDSSNHKQPGLNLYSGNHDIKIRCEDRAGNEVEGNARFEIEVDSDGPLITRVYNLGDILRVVTNEDSKCEYSLNSCSFDFGTGVLLSGGERVHTMSYTNGPTYRIKCQDGFGNVGTCFSVTGGY